MIDQNGQYRLDTQQALTALEEGSNWQELADFLQQRHTGPLPETLTAWLDKIGRHSQAFTRVGPALFIKTRSAELAEMVMADPVLQKMCRRVDDKNLVIPAGKEKAFRTRLKELEYVLLA